MLTHIKLISLGQWCPVSMPLGVLSSVTHELIHGSFSLQEGVLSGSHLYAGVHLLVLHLVVEIGDLLLILLLEAGVFL